MQTDSSTSPSTLDPKPGSRIVVIGGCGEIGRAVVDACVNAGCRVAVLDLQATLSKASLPAGCRSIPIDVSSESSVEQAFATLKLECERIDGLVFAVGITSVPPVKITDFTTAVWDELMQVNLRSVMFCARAAIPLMAEGGSFVTISSSLAYNPNKGFSAYVASKGGLVSFTKAIASEYAPALRANVVAPSAVDTAFLSGGTGRNTEGADKWFRDTATQYASTIPLGRVALPSDVVGPIMFLLGPGSRYMTGQVLHVNGGRLTP